MKDRYETLYRALVEIVSFFIRPKQDKVLLQKAGVTLDTALFPLLMQIAYHGSLGIVELASRVDRDHSTVSRQVDKLAALKLVSPAEESVDKRKRSVRLTDSGKRITDKIASTRRALMRNVLMEWSEDQLTELKDSLQHLAVTLHNNHS